MSNKREIEMMEMFLAKFVLFGGINEIEKGFVDAYEYYSENCKHLKMKGVSNQKDFKEKFLQTFSDLSKIISNKFISPKKNHSDAKPKP